MHRKNVSFLVAGSICGSFLVNAAMMACGKVGALPDAGGEADAASVDAVAGPAVLPPGMIVAYGGTQAPDGWLLRLDHIFNL